MRVAVGAALFIAIALLGGDAVKVTAQENLPSQSSIETESADAQAPSDEAALNRTAPAEDETLERERRRKLRLAVLTGGLIAVTGLALVVLTILGGSATRRGLRRRPLKEIPQPLETIPVDRFEVQEPVPTETNPETPADNANPDPDGETR